MNCKILTPFGLGLTLTSILVVIDAHVALSCYIQPCWREDYGSGKKGPAYKEIDLAQQSMEEGNYEKAKVYLDNALKLTKDSKDLAGQAIAYKGLAEVSAASGEKQKAISYLNKASKVYNYLGNSTKVMKLNQQIKNINRLKIQNTRP